MPSPLEKLFEIESELDAQSCTRIPEAVRRALQLQPGERLRYRIEGDGSVRLERAVAGAGATVAAPAATTPSLLGLAAGMLAGASRAQDGRLPTLDPRLIGALQGLAGLGDQPGRKPGER